MRAVTSPVGELVTNARRRQGISQARLADALGIEQSALSKKERGDRPFTDRDLLLAAVVLGVSPRDFMPENGVLVDPTPATQQRAASTARTPPRKPGKATNTAWTASRSRSTRPDQRKQVLVAA